MSVLGIHFFDLRDDPGLLTVGALLGVLVPAQAHRATPVDPLIALRHE